MTTYKAVLKFEQIFTKFTTPYIYSRSIVLIQTVTTYCCAAVSSSFVCVHNINVSMYVSVVSHRL